MFSQVCTSHTPLTAIRLNVSKEELYPDYHFLKRYLLFILRGLLNNVRDRDVLQFYVYICKSLLHSLPMFFFLLFSQQVLNDLSRKRATPDYGDSSRLLQRLNGASPVQLL